MSMSARSAPVDDLTNQARRLLEEGNNGAALIAANKAVVISPDHYKAHYYVAMAKLALRDFPGAQSAATKSLNLAPASAKTGVSKLVDAISSQMSLNGDNKDAIIFLSCSGEGVREDVRSNKQTTGPFSGIYRVNLTQSKFATWIKGSWTADDCQLRERPKEGYIDWSHEPYCAVTSDEFSWGYVSKETRDNGDRSYWAFHTKIFRPTGVLESKTEFQLEWDGKKTGFSENAKAECTPIDEPKSTLHGPVKF